MVIHNFYTKTLQLQEPAVRYVSFLADDFIAAYLVDVIWLCAIEFTECNVCITAGAQ